MPAKNSKPKRAAPAATPAGVIDRRALVEKALALLERRIEDDDVNSSLADLVRFLEIYKEWETERTRQVVVRFIEPEWAQKPE